LSEPCPPFQNFFRPLLELAGVQEVSVRQSADDIADQMNLSTETRLEMTRGGNVQKYLDRTYWAASYLRQAGLIVSPQRGKAVATDEGKKFLELYPEQITVNDLKTIQSFVDFQNRRNKKNDQPSPDLPEERSSLTPEDRISEALTEIDQETTSQILDRILNAPPAFFEKVVLDILVAMGYGGAQSNAARVVGKSGDNGIDGVIDQDQLGLDRVYVQAKRFGPDNKVGSGDIRNFSGSLELHKANKGLFFTTSSFSPSAMETAEQMRSRIVLINGEKLAQLMLENGVGCSSKKALFIMRIDEDYFDF
jgi:restriction system protein